MIRVEDHFKPIMDMNAGGKGLYAGVTDENGKNLVHRESTLALEGAKIGGPDPLGDINRALAHLQGHPDYISAYELMHANGALY